MEKAPHLQKLDLKNLPGITTLPLSKLPQLSALHYRSYHIKDGQYRNVSYKGNERKESDLPLDSDEITKYYKIFIQVGLTGTENGQEED